MEQHGKVPFLQPHVCLLGVRTGCDAEAGASAVDEELSRRWVSRAKKKLSSVSGLGPEPVCLGMLCAGTGEEQDGYARGKTPWHRGLCPRKRVGGDLRPAALGGMARLAGPCRARLGPGSPCCSSPVSSSLCCFSLLPCELSLVLELVLRRLV